ncbi:MAG: hypothetical protein DMF61_14885 [Blastocatellia bacterium AA13]|nr:MAG: hypothetical protein DMF61_14885 [Blastocatellia bacterium AA13]
MKPSDDVNPNPRSDEPSTGRSERIENNALHNEQQPGETESRAGDLTDNDLLVRPLVARPKPKKLKRYLIFAAAILVALGAVLVGIYRLSASQSLKINIAAKKPDRATDQAAASDKTPEDPAAEALAEVRSVLTKASAAPPSIPSVSSPALNSSANLQSQKLNLPQGTAALTAENTADRGDAKHNELSASNAGRRNQERSIRFPSDDENQLSRNASNSARTDSAPPRSDNSHRGASPESSFNTPRAKDAHSASLATPVVLPSFGSILPVRTLGKIYTLRSGSSIRLELTRYVSRDGWSLPKGTVLIGQVRGSEQDRAFIVITGFIDSSRDRFVKLNGEILGDDGGSGLHGKFHKLSSGWSRAFARVASTAVNVAGAVASSRISGQPVIITDAGSRAIAPFSSEVDSTLLGQARGFVEVPAGTAGFVMVTTLPAAAEGVDALPDQPASRGPNSSDETSQTTPLTQDELAALLTSGDPERIREALPRMSPQMRRIAEIVLAESSRQDKE